jgi:hypothetical protein
MNERDLCRYLEGQQLDPWDLPIKTEGYVQQAFRDEMDAVTAYNGTER